MPPCENQLDDDKQTRENIRSTIIIPYSILLFLILLAGSYGGYYLQQTHLNSEIDAKLLGVNTLFDVLINQESKIMHAQLELISKDPALINPWQAQDRKQLFAAASPLFASFKNLFGITHFYFIQPDQHCFLRVHARNHHGDQIKRSTMLTAIMTKKMAYGIELGPLGTFTLRVVYPIMVNQQLLGYLELGKEIENLTPYMKQASGLDLVFTVQKKYLERTKWEEGIKILGKQENWDNFENFVVIENTLPALPTRLKTFLISTMNTVAPIRKNVQLADKTFRIAAIPLNDVSQKTVGKIVGLFDITPRINALQHMLYSVIALVLFLACSVFLYFFYYSKRIEKKLTSYQFHLEKLVSNRTKDLEAALAEVKTLSGMLPICSYCKKIRDDKGYWQQIETYIHNHSDARFSHSICEECMQQNFPDITSQPEKSDKK